ncbi:helix-turn-helix domain-containing protein [Nesterenkonia ebinurensis]|uniref:helix-turn-helix domain-containing protein n=1 Tax=Nesterenkonia ebinurensis TaxID=2608252 RepID=UPI001CC3F020|nr:helix-turn-helix domain-containing protein [Nesterenkonia ebinurensis]
MAEDLGTEAVIAHLTTNPDLDWFREKYSYGLTGVHAQDLRELVYAAARTGNNKADLARELGLSRTTLYTRIRKLERITGGTFAGEHLQKLHFALLLNESSSLQRNTV